MSRSRTHKKLINESDIFKFYKCFEETIISDKELAKQYEEELIFLLKDKSKVKTLEEVIQMIVQKNPFEDGYCARDNFDYLIKNRLSLSNQDKVKNCFSYIIGNKKGNSLETMIQRHIMLSNKYNDIIGKPIFYEFPCNTYKADTLKDKQGKVPIDLITYDEKNKILYLIELKKCKGDNKSKDSNLSESDELFLRALLEITTYYSFFTHLIDTQKTAVEKALSEVGNVNIKFDNIKEIRKAILAPKVVYDNVYSDELLKELSKIDCFVISTVSDSIVKTQVNSPEKVFEIKRYERN